MANWEQLKEQLIDYASYNKLNNNDIIELYEEIIKDLQNDIKVIKGVKNEYIFKWLR